MPKICYRIYPTNNRVLVGKSLSALVYFDVVTGSPRRAFLWLLEANSRLGARAFGQKSPYSRPSVGLCALPIAEEFAEESLFNSERRF